jgi:DNA-binding NarL/FixJ family response regulator
MSSSGRSVRIVFADDSPMQRRVLRRLLELSRHVEVVGEATDGREAVELVQSTTPDLVLLDVEMPHLDGPSAAELIRSYYPQVRFLMHSTGASQEKRAQAAALGVTVLDESLLLDTVGLIDVMAAQMRPVIEPLVMLALADHDGASVLVAVPTRLFTTGSRRRCFTFRYRRRGSHSRPWASTCA